MSKLNKELNIWNKNVSRSPFEYISKIFEYISKIRGHVST